MDWSASGKAIACCLRSMFFFFSSRRRHTRFDCDWSSDVCSSDLIFGFIFREQAIVATGQITKFLVRLLDEFQDRLVEIIAASNHAIHVVFLVLEDRKSVV